MSSQYDTGTGRLVPGSQIEREAISAAQAGKSLVESCPYPWGKPAADHFRAIWFLNTRTTESTINPRPPAI